jgi:hypothetical protein
MKNISRYILVLIAILSLVVALPGLYWLSFEKPNRAPFVLYSCIENDFMIIDDGVRKDNKGNEYTLDEFEQKLPLLNMRQLLVSGTMPDSIKGFEMDPHEVNAHRSFFRYKPATKNAPKPELYPLFESESGRAQLEMPKDFFRIKLRMEFVDAATNTVDEEKTRMFTAVLQKRGFLFPAKMIEGIPTTRKSCDEGYFVVDSNDMLYHVKMIEGKPYVKKVDLPDGFKFKHIACVDFSDKKYYNYIFSEQNELYILTQDEYKLVKWPVENLNLEDEEIRIYGDFFNYNLISVGENTMHVIALDKDYNKVAEYNKDWLKRSETPQGKVFSYIFPAEISLDDKYSSFKDFYFHRSAGFNWIFLNVILLIIHFLIIRRRKAILKNHLIDFALVLVTGIFGFMAVNIFPNKFFD